MPFLAGGRLRPPSLFLMLVAAFVVAWPVQADLRPRVAVESFSYSEPVSLDAAVDGWRGGDFRGGRRQWSYNWVEVGVQADRWSLAALYRSDHDLRFHPDTAELYYRTRNRLPLDPARSYRIEAEVSSFSAGGLRAARRAVERDTFVLDIGASLFNTRRLLHGQLRGSARALSEKDYEYEVSVDYRYASDRLFDRMVEAPDGAGAALDAELAGTLGSRFRYQLVVHDLAGAIRWRDAPFTTAVASSDRKHFDEDGYVSIDPAVSGTEGYHARYTQPLHPRGRLGVALALTGRYLLLAEYQRQYGHGLAGYGVSARTGLGEIALRHWPETRALGFSLRGERAEWSLTTDALASGEPHTFWLAVRVH